MSESRVAYQETYQIPGYVLYGNALNKNFTLRAMTTREEKLRLSSTGMGTISQIIQNCLVSHPDLDVNELKLFDVQYLMYKLRIVTYGNEYKVKVRCPHCGNIMDLTVDLDKLKVVEVPEDFKEPFEIGPLPISGDVLQCRIFTVKDVLDILSESKAKLEKFPEMKEDPSFIIEQQHKIISINGEQKVPHFLQEYIENMHARDFQYFSSKYESLVDSFGIDKTVNITCDKCNSESITELPMTAEFFRPSY